MKADVRVRNADVRIVGPVLVGRGAGPALSSYRSRNKFVASNARRDINF